MIVRFAFFCSVLLLLAATAPAQNVSPPKVFLDKSPRIVAYQLKRLDDDRLLLVPRSTDDEKYIPVYEAILSRPAMAVGLREEAVAALAKLRDTSAAKELVTAIEKSDATTRSGARGLAALAKMLLRRPMEELQSVDADLVSVAESSKEGVRPVGFAGLIVAGKSDKAIELASDEASQVALLRAIDVLPRPAQQTSMRGYVIDRFEADASGVKSAAIAALSKLPADAEDTFQRLVSLVGDATFRIDACRGLLRLPAKAFDAARCPDAALALVTFAESTEPAKRTTDAFIDAMQAVDRLLKKVPAETAKSYRDRLREITVRVVKISTVEEEMRYNVPYFAVEAGRPLQIVLENHDLMPHNLVITQPGALKGVALGGLAAGPDGTNGLPYVPDSPNVIAASEMVAPEKSTRITLDAPTKPGEYPYVCTFPQHWYRMYGVMVVVEDLDAWNQNPVEPANPIGSNRSFVQAWKMDDFAGAFDNTLAGRSTDIGEKIFNEASCVGCHKVKELGGVVGPDLTDVYARYKGDHIAILREILEPSHKIDPKYAMRLILTVEGRTITGIVTDETDEKVTLISDPESKEPTIVLQDDIEDMVRSSTSMMPKALMDQFTKDEVLELMAYLQSVSPQK